MALDEKPSRNEDEYFAREEAELLKKRRAEAEAKARKEGRLQHFMKCPKCGADLKEMAMHGVQVDVCTECNGIWFDAGEIDQLKVDDRHPVKRVISDFFSGIRK